MDTQSKGAGRMFSTGSLTMHLELAVYSVILKAMESNKPLE